MNPESIADFPTPPRGGVVPQPNAAAPVFSPEPDRLMTPAEACQYCKLSRYRISAALEMRELRFVELGPRIRRIWLSDLRKWLDKKTVKASGRPRWLS